MDYHAEVTFEGEYVLARVRGRDSLEASRELWAHIARACREHDCVRVLGVTDMANALTTLEAYEHHAILEEVGITVEHRIAWVEHNPAAREIDEFIETVVTNRGTATGRVFADETEARRWLLDDAAP